MTSPRQFWDEKYREEPGPGDPNELAVELAERLPGPSAVLELGSGHGADALFLASRRHRVTACDFSAAALRLFAPQAREPELRQCQLDLADVPYAFGPHGFDAVYARLSLHYFPLATTRLIFAEIARLLRPGGVFLALFNSVFDEERGDGRMLEERFYQIAPGSRKRFFEVAEMPGLLGDRFSSVESRYVEADRTAEDLFVRTVAVTVGQPPGPAGSAPPRGDRARSTS